MDVFATKVNGEPVRVDLSHNKLVSVSTTSHGRALHIQSLNLSVNRLSSVPILEGLPLRYLNLDGNLITHIKEGAFAQLKDLVHLSISGLSELQDIEAYGFKGLQSLQVLDLSNNRKLKSLSPAVFSGLDSLQELNLSGSLSSLPNNMLTHLPSVKSITLGRGIHCWRTQKQGQFHRQLGQVQHDEVLSCNVEGVALWGRACAPLVLTIQMPELCLICFICKTLLLCDSHFVTSVSRWNSAICLKGLTQPSRALDTNITNAVPFRDAIICHSTEQLLLHPNSISSKLVDSLSWIQNLLHLHLLTWEMLLDKNNFQVKEVSKLQYNREPWRKH